MERRIENLEEDLKDFEDRFDGKVEKLHERITKHASRSELHQKENNSNQSFMINELSKMKDNDLKQMEILIELKTQSQIRHAQEQKNKEKIDKRLKVLSRGLLSSIAIIGTIFLTATGNALVDMIYNPDNKPTEVQTIEVPTTEQPKKEQMQNRPEPENFKGGE